MKYFVWVAGFVIVLIDPLDCSAIILRLGSLPRPPWISRHENSAPIDWIRGIVPGERFFKSSPFDQPSHPSLQIESRHVFRGQRREPQGHRTGVTILKSRQGDRTSQGA